LSASRKLGLSARKPLAISFEFFPPKSDEQAEALAATVARLLPYRPAYVSVTYGAGGTTQDRSLGTVRRLHESGLAVAAHLTCAASTRDSLAHTIGLFREVGIERFVALRGDPPGGLLTEPYEPHPLGYRDTAQLVETLKLAGATEVSVSAYPERHPQSGDWDTDIATLKRKVDAGADRAITQFFYDNDLFEAYVDRARRSGIDIPIVPGIMPIHRFPAVCNFASRCGASIPDSVTRRFEGLDPEGEQHRRAAIELSAGQMSDLMTRGVTSFHIYTLNRAELSGAICSALGVTPDSGHTAACAA
jgi:methylenetetrahydrofolate reductase (NADPH)